MAKTIKAEQLRKGDSFFVRGKVIYARICSLIEGKELETRKERAKGVVIDKPHTFIEIRDAVPIVKDPANPTLIERFAMEHIYTRQGKDGAPNYNCFEGISKSTLRLPALMEMNEDGTYTRIEKPEGDPAAGLDVTVMMSVFTTKSGKTGVGLSAVLVNEPIRYNNKNPLYAALEKAGIVVTNPVLREAAAPATDMATEEVKTADIPAPAPAATPANVNPVPVAPAAPATFNSPAPAVPTQPNLQNAPFAQNAYIPDNNAAGGIVYDNPNDKY